MLSFGECDQVENQNNSLLGTLYQQEIAYYNSLDNMITFVITLSYF